MRLGFGFGLGNFLEKASGFKVHVAFGFGLSRTAVGAGMFRLAFGLRFRSAALYGMTLAPDPLMSTIVPYQSAMTLIIECTRTRTLLCFGHGCYSDRMLVEHKRYYGLGMEATATVCSWNTNVITAMDGNVTVCSWNTNAIMIWAWTLSSSSALEHERHYGLGMDAAMTVCSWNTNVIMVWAWVLQ